MDSKDADAVSEGTDSHREASSGKGESPHERVEETEPACESVDTAFDGHGDNENGLQPEFVEYFQYTGDLLNNTKKTLIQRANVIIATISIFIGSIALAIDASVFSSQLLNILFILPMILYIVALNSVMGVIRAYPDKGGEDEQTMFHYKWILETENTEYDSQLADLDEERLRNMTVTQFTGLSRYIDQRYTYVNRAYKLILAGIILETIILIYSFLEPNYTISGVIGHILML
jgi:hypothetical protein